MLNAILQGVIQGLTEFLPVSSSGHLTLFQYFKGLKNMDANMLMDIGVHFGTLVAVIFYFRSDLLPYFTIGGWKQEKNRKIALLIIMGSIPTAIIGLTLKKHFEVLFAMPKVVCVALFLTGLVLLLSEKLKNKNNSKTISELSYSKAALIGIAQGMAITPGISRSGSTISAGLLSGLSGEEAARFSFLLMIPAVSGATLLEIKKVASAGLPVGFIWSEFLVASLTSAITGLLALSLLVYIIKKQRLNIFAYYLFIVSILSFTAILMGK